MFLQEVFRPEWFHKLRCGYFDLPAPDQHPGNRFSQKAIICGHEDARLPLHNRAPVHARGNFSCCFIGPEIAV